MSEPDEHTLLQTEAGQGESRQASQSHFPDIEGYEFVGKAGSGSFGDVWQAVQSTTGQDVAVKLFKLNSLGVREQFQLELERLRKLAAHPHIVGLIDADLRNDPPYLVMPWLPNNLASFEEQTVEAVLPLLRQIAEALKFTHEKGLLHCDLKPGNVLLDEGGQIRLADFGQSLVLGQDQGSWGTLGWMPPEQALLEENAVPTTSWDIYAWGNLAYFLLTRQQARVDRTYLESLRSEATTSERLSRYAAGLRERPLKPLRASNAKVDQDLADLVESCLALEPTERPQSVSDILEDFRRRSSGEPLLCRRPWSLAYRTRKLLARPLVMASLLFLCMAVLGAGYSYAKLDSKNKELTKKQVQLLFERGSLYSQTDEIQALFSWSEASFLAPGDHILRSNIQKPTLSLRHQIPIQREADPVFGTFHFNDKMVWLLEVDVAKRATILRSWDLTTGKETERQVPRNIVGKSEALGGVILARTPEGIEVLKVATLESVGEPLPGDKGWLSGDGQIVVTETSGKTESTLHFFQLSTGISLLQKELATSHFTLAHDGRTFAVQTDQGVDVHNLEGEIWHLPETGAQPISVSEDTVLTKSSGQHSVWNYKKAEKSKILPKMRQPVFNPRGLLGRTIDGFLWQDKDWKRAPLKIPTSASYPAISPKARFLAGCTPFHLKLWSSQSGQLLSSTPFSQDTKGIVGVAFNQAETQLATFNGETLLIYDVDPSYSETRSPGKTERVTFGAESAILALKRGSQVESWTPPEPTLTVSQAQPSEDWRWADGNTRYYGQRESVGTQLAAYTVATRDGSRVEVVSREGEKIRSFPTSYHKVIALNSSDDKLAVAHDQEVTIYEVQSAKVLKVLEMKDGLHSLQWVGEHLVVGRGSTVQNKQAIVVYDGHTWESRTVEGQRFTGASQKQNMLVGSTSQRTTIYDLSTLETLWSEEGYSLLALFSPRRKAVLLADIRSIRYLDAESGKPLLTPLEWTEEITALSLSDDEERLAVSGGDGLLRLYVLPAPQKGSPKELRARIEAWTGYTTGPAGRLEKLPRSEWEKLRASSY